MITLGETLDLSMYEPLHRIPSSSANSMVCDTNIDQNERESDNAVSMRDINDLSSTEVQTITDERNDALESLNTVYEVLREKIENGNIEIARGVNVLAKRCHKMNQNQLISSLYSFGGAFVNRSKGKIRVQPTAVSRRKSKTGSRSKQSTLPHRLVTIKRRHNISEAIQNNVQSAKKAGRAMKSTTTYPARKRNSSKEKSNNW